MTTPHRTTILGAGFGALSSVRELRKRGYQGAITLVALTVLRIDWAKHPEKYADAVEEQKKDQEKKAAQQRRKEMELPGPGDRICPRYWRSSGASR